MIGRRGLGAAQDGARGTLTARMAGGMVVLADAKGGAATVTQADVMQSNGVIHATNAVSLPG